MDTTTESVYSKTTTEAEKKEGVLIKGKNVIVLDAPEILPSPETPLLTSAKDIVGAINELKKLSSGEGGDDWQPPADWLTVPEPAPWEACFLIDLHDNLTCGFNFNDPETGYVGYGTITLDWGDGNVEIYNGKDENGEGGFWSTLSHTYAASGMYVIKAATDKFNCRFRFTDNRRDILIAKFGEKILLSDTDSGFNGWVRLHYFSSKGALTFPKRCFFGCHALRKINIAVPFEIIPESCFENAYQLTKFDFSNVIEIGDYAFQSSEFKEIYLPKCVKIGAASFSDARNLTEISAPACTSVGNGAFNNSRTLEKATFADGCTFGSNAFSYCYNLYPRPDGSTD